MPYSDRPGDTNIGTTSPVMTYTERQVAYGYTGNSGIPYGATRPEAQNDDLDLGTNDTIAQWFSSEQAKKFLDEMTGLPAGRKLDPPFYDEYIEYEHRINDTTNTIRIGDCQLVIPPDFIAVKEIRNIDQVVSLRQESTMKDQAGYSRKEITITAFFNGKNQINGYPVESPFDRPYYVDGLRPLLAQFKCSPFLPIVNDFLNETNDIWNIALQSINVNTVQGFPDVLQATIIAHEFNAVPYIEAPNFTFHDCFDWDLFRFYYQQLLDEKDNAPQIKNRKLFPASVEGRLNEEITMSVLDLDKVLGDKFNEEVEVTDDLFRPMISNTGDDPDNFVIAEMNFGISNMLTFLQLSAHSSPTMQYLGGSDTMISFNIETTDVNAVRRFREISDESKKIALNSRGQEGIGVLKVENDILNILGAQFLMVDNCTIATVPDFPGKYNIYLECLGYDMRTKDREDLRGFRPFAGSKKGEKKDAISRTPQGLKNKIVQESVAEKRLNEMELYPDLFLPLYSEVDKAVEKIRTFRSKKGLSAYHYSGKYPRKTSAYKIQGASIYEKFVDPDFYVNYSFDYSSMEDVLDMIPVSKPNPDKVDVSIEYQITEVPASSPYTSVETDQQFSNYSGGQDYSGLSPARQNFLKHLFSQLNKGYVYGAIGQTLTGNLMQQFKRSYPGINKGIDKWLGQVVFDCSGFIAWGLWKTGLKSTAIRTSSAVMVTDKWTTPISKSELIPGDMLYKKGHVAIYIGDGKTIEAANVSAGVITSTMGNRFTAYRRFIGLDSMQGSTGVFGASSSRPSNGLQTSVNSSGNRIQSDRTGGYVSTSTSSSMKIGKFGSERHDQYDALILKYAEKYKLNPNYMKALMRQESNMDAKVVNHVPAVGLMQITKNVFKEFGEPWSIPKAQNPEFNIDFGFRYAKFCLDMFDGNYEYMVQGYNMGPYGFKAYLRGEKTLPRETKTHVVKINGYYEQLIRSGGSASSGSGEYNSAGNTIDSGYSEVKVSTYKVDKKHGEKTAQFNGGFGEPLFFMSPVNNLVNDVQPSWNIGGDVQSVSDRLASALSHEMDFKSAAKTEWLPKYKNIEAAKVLLNETDKAEIKELVYDYLANPSHNLMMLDLMNVYTSFEASKSSSEDQSATEADLGKYGLRVIEGQESSNSKVISRMTVDMKNYSCKKTLLRAFPTYAFLIVDESGDWLDGKKLWSNYYTYKSIMNIQVHDEKTQPVKTAILTVTNSSKKLEKIPKEHLFKKGIEDDKEYNTLTRWLFRHTGVFIGGLKVTQQAVDEKNKLIESVKLDTGARIHIRMGYGSNPAMIPVVFNGTITEMDVGNMITMVAQSDGVELINNIVTTKKEDVNKISLLQQEPSDIMASLLTDKDKILLNMIDARYGEKNRYGIEHFGSPSVEGGNSGLARKREYDVCKNIYLGKYKKSLFCGSDHLPWLDGEGNVQMFLFNKTPWDIMQLSAHTLPEFVCQPMYHQFDTRLFFGLPSWNAKYRYDYDPNTDVIYEYAKSFSQYHIVDSVGDIIENKVKCTDKKLYSNAIAMYTVSGDFKSTPILYSDKSIDWSRQKTKVIDTTILQDYIGPDSLYHALGITRKGKDNAINVGVANLVDSYEEMYSGELIVMGNPSLKSCDYIMIGDLYADMNGLATVRSVTHSFSMETGMTTSITPGLISYSKMKDAGSTNLFSSLLGLGTAVTGAKTLRWSVIFAGKKLSHIKRIATAYKYGAKVDEMYKALKTAAILKAKPQIYTWAKEVVSFAKASRYYTVAREASLVKAAANAKAIGAFAVTNLPGVIIYIGATVIINTILESVIDYFTYNNCVGIRPLIHKNRYFVTRVKGQQKLIDGSNNGSSTNIMAMDEEWNNPFGNVMSSGEGLGGGFSGGTSDGGGGNGGGSAF